MNGQHAIRTPSPWVVRWSSAHLPAGGAALDLAVRPRPARPPSRGARDIRVPRSIATRRHSPAVGRARQACAPFRPRTWKARLGRSRPALRRRGGRELSSPPAVRCALPQSLATRRGADLRDVHGRATNATASHPTRRSCCGRASCSTRGAGAWRPWRSSRAGWNAPKRPWCNGLRAPWHPGRCYDRLKRLRRQAENPAKIRHSIKGVRP